MQEMLGEEYAPFLSSYDNKKYQSLRVNPLKTDREAFLRKTKFHLTPVAWEKNGFYYEEGDQPGKHPLHEAGLYYIQEASAMAPAVYLEAEPGEQVLDLCAAPGGKTTQIGAAMGGQGILICNEIHPARAKILSENVERMGITNAIVTNETPDGLLAHFPEYFDRVLVDAPCSGEGMFRKNEDACGEWSPENVEMCGRRQDEILDCAAQMVRGGGRLVYSTCTFAPIEDEDCMRRFLTRHPEFSIEKTELFDGMERGRAAWAYGKWSLQDGAEPADRAEHTDGAAPGDSDLAGAETLGLENTVRLWPHKLAGEGHYLAVLKKEGSVPEGYRAKSRYGMQQSVPAKDCSAWFDFAKEALKKNYQGVFVKFGEQLYLAPENAPSLKGLKVLRPGLHLGTLKKNRFGPSHALALAMKPSDAANSLDFPAESAEIKGYLNGMTLNAEGAKGWYLVTAEGCSIGWGKLAGNILKNHYPKGLRKNW